MKLFREAIIIFGIYLLGVLIADVTSTISNFFLDHLAFFFIPAGVGLISSFTVIKDIWLQLLIVCFITTVITMACTGRIVQRIANKKEGDKNGKFN